MTSYKDIRINGVLRSFEDDPLHPPATELTTTESAAITPQDSTSITLASTVAEEVDTWTDEQWKEHFLSLHKRRNAWSESLKRQQEKDNAMFHSVRETAERTFERTGDYERSLEAVIPRLERYLGGATIKVSVYDLKQMKPLVSIRGGEHGWAASIIKVPVMIATHQAYDRGTLRPDDEFVIDHKYTLEPGDPVSRMNVGDVLTATDLVNAMMAVSDNEATNMLADKLGLEYVNRAARQLGARRTMLAHLLAPKVPRLTALWNRDGSNLTTTDDMTLMLKAIYTDRAASPESCDRMRRILEGETPFKCTMTYLGRYLPKNAQLGNKIGHISDWECGDDMHDVGVVNREYVVSIMCNKVNAKKNLKRIREESRAPRWSILCLDETGNEEDEVESMILSTGQGSRVIGTLSRIVYNAFYAGDKQHHGYRKNWLRD